jgi:hypothetical protein
MMTFSMMLSVVYAACRGAVRVARFIAMLSVVIPRAILPSVVVPD